MASNPTDERKFRNKQEIGRWVLRLYIAGQTPNSLAAFESLKQICKEHLLKKCRIEVIDLLKSPQLARENQIVAVPTLVRIFPGPARRLIGDLSNSERVLAGLGVGPRVPA